MGEKGEGSGGKGGGNWGKGGGNWEWGSPLSTPSVISLYHPDQLGNCLYHVYEVIGREQES